MTAILYFNGRPVGPDNPIPVSYGPWSPITLAPKDGTHVLLWYPAGREPGRSGSGLECGGWIEGWWHSSPKGIDDGWETVIGFIGEPTHYMDHPGEPD